MKPFSMIYPKHIAIIPDWNRTRAKEKWLPQLVWHIEGSNNVVNLMKYCFNNTDVRVFTAWWLSTENLMERSKEELEYLFDIYKDFLLKFEWFLKENKINFRWIWNEKWLPLNLVELFKQKQEELFFGKNSRYVVIAINYWWRDEILRWVNKIKQDKSIEWEITEEQFTKYLDLWDLPNIDLVIRTKGDVSKRLSGFLLWWIWYAELYFSPKKCPEFNTQDFDEALRRFDEISSKRNFWK